MKKVRYPMADRVTVRVVLLPDQFNQQLIEWIFGDENRWYAGQAVGHLPSRHECVKHFYQHGGIDAFNAKFINRSHQHVTN